MDDSKGNRRESRIGKPTFRFGIRIALVATAMIAALVNAATFTAPGAWTYTVPANVYFVSVLVAGGGGGGGGIDSAGNGGKGGTGASISATLAVTPGQVITGTVAGGGGGGLTGNATTPSCTGGGASGSGASSGGSGGAQSCGSGYSGGGGGGGGGTTLIVAGTLLQAGGGGGGGGGSLNEGSAGAGTSSPTTIANSGSCGTTINGSNGTNAPKDGGGGGGGGGGYTGGAAGGAGQDSTSNSTGGGAGGSCYFQGASNTLSGITISSAGGAGGAGSTSSANGVAGGAGSVTITPLPALRIQKTWNANAKAGDGVSISTSGGASIATVASAATALGNTTSGSVVVESAGNVITFPTETFTTGSATNYTTALTCSGNTNALTAGSAGTSTLTLTAADTNVICSYVNARKSATLELLKTWVGATSGEQIAVTTSGGVNNASVTSTSSGGSAQTGSPGAAVSVYAGDTIALPAETFSGPDNAGAYVAGVTCSGNANTLAGSAPPQNFTVSPSDSAIACTYSNSRLPTLVIAKISNGTTGTFTFSGITNATPSGDSVTTSLSGTAVTSGSIHTIIAPAVAVQVTEATSPAYTLTAATCGDANDAVTGNPPSFGVLASPVLTLPATFVKPGSVIKCTFTNSVLADISISKSNASATYVPGGSAIYTLIISNGGPNSVSAATVSDLLPKGMTLVAPGVTCLPTASCSGSAHAYPFAGDGSTNILSGLLVNLPTTGSTTISVPITYSTNPADY